MEELNAKAIEKDEVSEQETNEMEKEKIVELFFTSILISNILYFIANNDIVTVYVLLQTINADEEFFSRNKHYDYDSIERQFIHAKEFYKNGQDEDIAKTKACIYYLYQMLEMDNVRNKPIDDDLELMQTVLNVIIATLNQFLYKANCLIIDDIEEKFTNFDLEKVFFEILYHNMKVEKLITKSKFEKLLK